MARRTYKLAREIGQRLEIARADSGITVRDLAKRAMVDPGTIINIAGGKSLNPGVGTIADLAKALGVDPRWLAYGDGEPR